MIIDFEAQRKKQEHLKLRNIALSLIEELDKAKGCNYLGFGIDLIVNSIEASKRELPNILRALSGCSHYKRIFEFDQEEAADYLSSDKNFNLFLGVDSSGNILVNENAYPLSWIVSHLENKGYLKNLKNYFIYFTERSASSVRIYGSVYSHCFPGKRCGSISDSFREGYPFLLEEVHREEMDDAIIVLNPKIDNYVYGIPVLQKAFQGIKDQTGFYVVCHGPDNTFFSEPDSAKFDGVLYKPHDFASFSLEDLALVQSQILERCDMQRKKT